MRQTSLRFNGSFTPKTGDGAISSSCQPRQWFSVVYSPNLRVMSTQLLGFSFAGYLNRSLVRPASMIWPSTLVNTARSFPYPTPVRSADQAVFNTLHAKSGPIEGRTKSKARQTFFYVQMIGMFAWSFLPSYLFTALSNVSRSLWTDAWADAHSLTG